MISSMYLRAEKLQKPACPSPLTVFVCMLWKVCLLELKATDFHIDNKGSSKRYIKAHYQIQQRANCKQKVISQNTTNNIWINRSSDTGGSHTANSRSTARARKNMICRKTFQLAFRERLIILGKFLWFIFHEQSCLWGLTITNFKGASFRRMSASNPKYFQDKKEN